MSQGFVLSTGANYLPHSKSGSFELAEAGINFTKPLDDRLRMGLQLFARDFGQYGNYSPSVDWFYLDYHFADWFGIRAGRVKVPFGLYNEISDIDAARVPILPPQALYPARNRDYLLAQTGGEIYGRVSIGGAGALDYRFYGGTMFVETMKNPPGTPYETGRLEIPYVLGSRVLWETPLEGLRMGASAQWIRVEADLLFDPMVWMPMQMAGDLPANFTGKVTVELPVLLSVGSIEYAAHDWLLVAEYSRWTGKIDSSQPSLLPEQDSSSERLYGLAAYRVSRWFEPGLYYGLLFPNTHDRRGRDSRQHDTALTLRFDVNDFWLVKVEGHYLNGTADLSSDINDGKPKLKLPQSWTLFMVKTTAYF